MFSLIYKLSRWLIRKLTPGFIHYYRAHRVDVRTGKHERYYTMARRIGKYYRKRRNAIWVGEEFFRAYGVKDRLDEIHNSATRRLLFFHIFPIKSEARYDKKKALLIEKKWASDFAKSFAALCKSYTERHSGISSKFHHFFFRLLLDFVISRMVYVRRGLSKWNQLFWNPIHFRFYKFFIKKHFKWTRWFLFRFSLVLLINLARPIWFGIPYFIFYMIFRSLVPLVYNLPYGVCYPFLYIFNKPGLLSLKRWRDRTELGYFTLGRLLGRFLYWFPRVAFRFLDLFGWVVARALVRYPIFFVSFLFSSFLKLVRLALSLTFIWLPLLILWFSFQLLVVVFVLPLAFLELGIRSTFWDDFREATLRYFASRLPPRMRSAKGFRFLFLFFRWRLSYDVGYSYAMIEWLPKPYRGPNPSPLRRWVRRLGYAFGPIYRAPLMFLGYITYYPLFQFPIILASWWSKPWYFTLRERIFWRVSLLEELSIFNFIRKKNIYYRWWSGHDDYSRSDFFGPEMSMSYLFYFYIEVYDKWANYGDMLVEADMMGDLAFAFRESSQRMQNIAYKLSKIVLFIHRLAPSVLSYFSKLFLGCLLLVQAFLHAALSLLRLVVAGISLCLYTLIYWTFNLLNSYLIILINCLYYYRSFSVFYTWILAPLAFLFLFAEWLWLIEPILVYLQNAPKGILGPYDYNWFVFGLLPLAIASLFSAKARVMFWEVFYEVYPFAISCFSYILCLAEVADWPDEVYDFSLLFLRPSSVAPLAGWLQYSPLAQGLPYYCIYVTSQYFDIRHDRGELLFEEEILALRTSSRFDFDAIDLVWEQAVSLF